MEEQRDKSNDELVKALKDLQEAERQLIVWRNTAASASQKLYLALNQLERAEEL